MDSRLFRVKKNQVEMMRRRGYDTSREDGLFDMTLEQFYQTYDAFARSQGFSFRRALLGVYQRGEDQCLVAFLESKGRQVGLETVRKFIELFQAYHCNEGIIITEQPLSSDSVDELNKTTAQHVQHFLDAELCFVPLDHFLNPKFRVVPEAEARAWLEKNRLRTAMLPIILRTDPVIKYLGVPRGTLIQEQHTSLATETMTDTYLSYSIVG